MRKFFAFRPSAAPPAYEKVVSVVILTILLGFVLTGFGNPKQLQANLEGLPQAQETQQYLGYDRQIRKFLDGTYLEPANYAGGSAAAAPIFASGNIIMRFQNFDMGNSAVQGRVQWFYYRAAYAAYPQRVFVADKDTVIPHQPLYTPPIPDFNTTEDWAGAHGIKRIVTLVQQPTGIGFSPQELSLPDKP